MLESLKTLASHVEPAGHLHREAVRQVQLAALTFQLHSPPRRCPFKSPWAAAALTEGLCHFPSDYHSHFCLYYQQSARAVSQSLPGRAADLYLATLLPCHEPEQKRGRKSKGGGFGVAELWGGKGRTREEGGGCLGGKRMRKEKREKPTKKPLGRRGVGQGWGR